MKLQLNGFDIEINTDDVNITLKIMDANGKELSNNTYSQSMDQSDDVIDVDVPETEEIADDAETSEEEPIETGDDTELTDEESGVEDEDNNEEEMGESFIVDFETFKRNLRK